MCHHWTHRTQVLPILTCAEMQSLCECVCAITKLALMNSPSTESSLYHCLLPTERRTKSSSHRPLWGRLSPHAPAYSICTLATQLCSSHVVQNAERTLKCSLQLSEESSMSKIRRRNNPHAVELHRKRRSSCVFSHVNQSTCVLLLVWLGMLSHRPKLTASHTCLTASLQRSHLQH